MDVGDLRKAPDTLPSTLQLGPVLPQAVQCGTSSDPVIGGNQEESPVRVDLSEGCQGLPRAIHQERTSGGKRVPLDRSWSEAYQLSRRAEAGPQVALDVGLQTVQNRPFRRPKAT